jgi:two-component system sensor histidine kinase HydH
MTMAALAAAALAATVLVAQRALENASLTVVRGEGETLVAALLADLGESGAVDSARLERERVKYAAAGLRYVAVLDRDGVHARAEAGESTMAGRAAHAAMPGQLSVAGHRVRLTASMQPPPRDEHPPPWKESDDGRPPPSSDDEHPRLPPDDDDDHPPPPPDEPRAGRPPLGDRHGRKHFHPPGGGPPPFDDHHRGHPPGPHHALVIEFEPPVFEQLRTNVARTVVVGAVAGVVLIAFAIAWSRGVARLAAVERQAEGERRLVALGRMSSVMAHELRNPLASLKGHAQLLSEALEGDAAARARAERVVGDAERLERLMDSLLDFVRDGPLDRRPMAPAELVASALEHLPASRFAVDLARAPDTLWVDAGRVARALQNLAQNALQATSEGASPAEPVELSVEAVGDGTLFTVRDHGPGLPGGEAQIFEPFVTTRVRGTGLGLPIARRIAEQHGGKLTGETHPAGGAVFRLVLPGAARGP